MNTLKISSDIQAEEGLLSTICRDTSLIDECIDSGVTIDWFISPLNQEIWTSITEAPRESDIIDVDVMLMFEGEKRSDVQEVLMRCDTSRMFGSYFEKCKEDFRKRCLMRLVMEVQDELHGCTSDKLVERVEHKLTQISLSSKDDIRHAHDIVDSMWAGIQKRMEVSGMSGIPSGITQLDSYTYGWQPSDMIILAARTSVGKTAFGCELALSALKHDKNVLFFSLEMKAEAVMQRMISNISEVPLGYIVDRTARESDIEMYQKAMSWMKTKNLWIDDRGSVNSAQVRSKARKLARKGLDFIVLDYAQKMTPMDPRIPREQQVAEIAGSIKSLAMELNIPIILLSQLNRGADELNRKPRLSDIRESGALEQDADVVAMLWRKNDDPQETIISINKQRQGRCGDVEVCFEPKIQKFTQKPRLN